MLFDCRSRSGRSSFPAADRGRVDKPALNLPALPDSQMFSPAISV